MNRFLIIAGALVLATGAHATGDFGATWQYGVGGLNGSIVSNMYSGGAGQFTASRLVGAPGGTSTDLPFSTGSSTFQAKTFCVELNESIGGGPYLHNVYSLLGSTTVTGGITFGATRTDRLRDLWAHHTVTNGNEAAAFQLAQWNLTFDTDTTLGGGTFNATGTNATIYNMAESWLGQLGTLGSQRTNLFLLSSGGVQDQITAWDGGGPGGPPGNPTPEPFTMGLGLASAGLFVRRRLKAKRA